MKCRLAGYTLLASRNCATVVGTDGNNYHLVNVYAEDLPETFDVDIIAPKFVRAVDRSLKQKDHYCPICCPVDILKLEP